MSTRILGHSLPVLAAMTLLGACEGSSPTNVLTQPSLSVTSSEAVRQANEERRDILERYEGQLWPCPPEFEPILIHEQVAMTPPLKAPGDPDFWEECPETPGHFTNHNSSSGTSAHLGAFTNEWDSCLDVIHGVGFFHAQLTAANGDDLNWDITATASPRSDGGLHFETTDVTFDGGTGRFEGATGYAGGAGNSIPGHGEDYYYVGCLAY